MRRRTSEPQIRHEERDADRAAEQAMAILPPENALELGERHRMVDVAELRRRLVLRECLVPVGAARCGGSVPTIGCHSVIDSPECVRRVTPPTTTIANTSTQQAASQRDERAVRRGIDCTGARGQGAGGCGIGGRHNAARHGACDRRARPARCRPSPRRTRTRRRCPPSRTSASAGNCRRRRAAARDRPASHGSQTNRASPSRRARCRRRRRAGRSG